MSFVNFDILTFKPEVSVNNFLLLLLDDLMEPESMMIAKTGLLIVSNPKQISKVLASVQKQVKNTLYIQLLSALSDPFGQFHIKTLNSWPKCSRTIFNIYSQVDYPYL